MYFGSVIYRACSAKHVVSVDSIIVDLKREFF